MQPYGKRGSQTVRASDSRSTTRSEQRGNEARQGRRGCPPGASRCVVVRLSPRGCLVASRSPVVGGSMSWQCIALASAQPHPVAIASTGQSMSTTKRPQGLPNLRRPRHAAAEDGCQLTHKGPIRRRGRHHHATIRSQRLPFASQQRTGTSSSTSTICMYQHQEHSISRRLALAALSNRLFCNRHRTRFLFALFPCLLFHFRFRFHSCFCLMLLRLGTYVLPPRRRRRPCPSVLLHNQDPAGHCLSVNGQTPSASSSVVRWASSLPSCAASPDMQPP
ncbi:hypothetical protein HDV57DRAFT_152916 [Trichoderma longibrachiatum]